jgi:hypothetical protein
MKNYMLLFCLLTIPGFKSIAQITDTITASAEVKTITRDGLTLHFIRNVPFSSVTQHRLIDAFFTVYPAEMKRFNQNSITEVTFLVDSGYKGVAATSHGLVRFNPEWFKKHPEDIDVVTHEVMHIVQNYGGKHVPGWLTEGIADYARYIFGINNAQSGWSLTPYKLGQSYTNAYRITARFLVWSEKNKKQGLVDILDSNMRAGTYTPELWNQQNRRRTLVRIYC